MRGDHQHGALAEQSPPLFLTKRDAPEPAAVHAGNAVMPREPFVDERVVGADEIQHAAIFTERARQKQPRLLFEGLQQAVVEVRIRIGIDDDLADAAEVQPLGGEVVDERARGARVGQHAPHLLLERRRLRQLAVLRGVE